MAGQRVGGEEQFERTNLTVEERKKLIAKLRKQGLTERAIAKQVGMSPTGVHWICAELAGKKRNQQRMEMCEGCWESVPASQLNQDGLCREDYGSCPHR